MTTHKTIADLLPAGATTDNDLFETSQAGISRSVTLGQMGSSIVSDVTAILASGGTSPVSSVAALKALTTRPSVIVTRGYNAANDGGAGPPWQWVAGSTATADDFLVVQPTAGPAGRYVRMVAPGQTVSPTWAGAGLGAADDTARLQVVLSAAGGHAVDCSGCTLPILGVSVAQTASCPGIFSNGTGQITCAPGTTSGTFLVSIYKSDFTVDRMFFNGPTSTVEASPPACSTMLSYETPTPTAQTDRLRVTNCRFYGGGTGFQARNIGNSADLYVLNNTFHEVFGNATSLLGFRNAYFQGNTAEHCCYTSVADAAFHFGNVYDQRLSDNLIVSGNIVRDCFPTGITQESMDFHGYNCRNVVIANNIMDRTFYGGIEIKKFATATAPNFWGDVLIANNLVSFVSAAGGTGAGVALNYSGALDHEQVRYKISGNQFVCDDPTRGATAIVVDAYDTVEITDNMINSLSRGILVTASGSPTQTAFNITIQSNRINVAGIGIQTSRTIQGLTIKDNVIKAGGQPLQSIANLTGLVCTGNHFECTTSDYGTLISNVQSGVFENNTVISGHTGIYFDSPACNNLRLFGNDVGGYWNTFSVNVASPTLTIANNDVDCYPGNATFGGAGSCVSYDNRRLGQATIPSSWAGLKGDIVLNSAPASGGFIGWVCTTAGAAGVAVWKGYGAIA